ncbi:DUF4383 domain-containing protein [Streptomyces sp. R302]|nr:DUF4383 domain-containing protein [Streptomyces sp. R301]NML81610.1 DUF4383 domain-containing protein [Streptomyces sp. R302]
MAPRHSLSRPARSARPVRSAAGLVGLVLLVVAVLGFVPGVTTGVDEMAFAGHESGAELFGVFQVSVLHNAVHLLFGAAGVVMSRTAGTARAFLVGGGFVYLLLWLYGVLVDLDGDANFVPFDTADNWLHLGLGAAMVLLGVVLGGRRSRAFGR